MTFHTVPRDAPALVSRRLGPQEIHVATVRMHPSVLIPPIILGIGGLFAAIAVAPIVRSDSALKLTVWLFAGLLLAQLGRAVLHWLTEYIVITQLRVFICNSSGITSSSPLKQVSDVRVTRSIAGRLFGFGTLVFDSAHIAIDNVPYPEQVYAEIYALLDEERPSLPSVLKGTFDDDGSVVPVVERSVWMIASPGAGKGQSGRNRPPTVKPSTWTR